jgi:hypothetical protein
MADPVLPFASLRGIKTPEGSPDFISAPSSPESVKES